jgi:protein required for attachment to host cells
MRKIVTWIVVADHQHARFFQNDGPDRGIRPIADLSLDTRLARSHDLLSDREGRGVSSRDGRRYGIPLQSDPHRQEGLVFIGQVAEVVAKGLSDRAYDRLVLIAPPRALGELRKALAAPVRAKVIGELSEDLTKATSPEILAHLGDYIAA